MVVAGAADVLVDQQRGIGRDAIGGAVLSVFEDRSDRAVRAGAERQCADAGDLDATGAEALDQAEDPDTGAEPLLRMRPGAQRVLCPLRADEASDPS